MFFIILRRKITHAVWLQKKNKSGSCTLYKVRTSWERTYIGWFDILHKQFKLIRVSKALPPTARVSHLTNNEQML